MSDSGTPRDLGGVPESPSNPRALVALTLVMERRLALDDAVRVLMARQGIDRRLAMDAIVQAAAFVSDEYGAYPLDGQFWRAL